MTATGRPAGESRLQQHRTARPPAGRGPAERLLHLDRQDRRRRVGVVDRDPRAARHRDPFGRELVQPARPAATAAAPRSAAVDVEPLQVGAVAGGAQVERRPAGAAVASSSTRPRVAQPGVAERQPLAQLPGGRRSSAAGRAPPGAARRPPPPRPAPGRAGQRRARPARSRRAARRRGPARRRRPSATSRRVASSGAAASRAVASSSGAASRIRASRRRGRGPPRRRPATARRSAPAPWRSSAAVPAAIR